eukprot:TRINITY_DN1053_c0_g1_i1.p1 TRINITY_DN1053_c0_g1~~TRINITY_DN1053_c0_g1_i1.p1  ORF type:complete len:401 (-),score=21.52 TRINITY_DN1053_c0_g1_i1:85-1248(-)
MKQRDASHPRSAIVLLLIVGFNFFTSSNAAIQIQRNEFDVYSMWLSNQLQSTSLGSTHAIFCANAYPPSGGVILVNATGDVDLHSVTSMAIPLTTTVQDRYFIITGGDDFTNLYHVFDASTDSWSNLVHGQEIRFRAATSVGKFAVFAGGEDNNGALDQVSILDTSNNSWQSSSLSSARIDIAATSAGDLAFFAGGRPSYNDWNYVPHIDTLNVTSMTWSIRNMTAGASNFVSAASVPGFAIIVSNNIADIFDVSTQTWSTHTMDTWNYDTFVKDDLVFFLPGYGQTYVEVFNSTSQTWFNIEMGTYGCLPAGYGKFVLFACAGPQAKIYDLEQQAFVATETWDNTAIWSIIGAATAGDLFVMMAQPTDYYNTRNFLGVTLEISETP